MTADQHQTPARAPLLSGARVFLRHPAQGDQPEIAALRRASDAWLGPWEPWISDGRPMDPDTLAARMVETSLTETGQRHLACLIGSGTIIGMCNLSQIFRGPFDNCVLGYWCGRVHAGKGYMTEGVGLVLRRCFQHLGLHRVEANIMPRNQPSRALARRCGFRLEGYSPNYLQIAGRWEGHERWAMTREDFSLLEAARADHPQAERGLTSV